MANAVMSEPRNGRHFQMPAPSLEHVGGVEKTFGEWASCVMKARSKDTPPNEREAVEKRLSNVYKSEYVVEKAAMGEGSGSVGGYLVPYEYQYGIMRDVAENSIFWPRAFVQPMASRTLLMPLPNPSTSQGVARASNMFGGMILQWRDTQINMPETEPQFQQVELVANTLDGYQLASNQMGMDFAGLGAFLQQLGARGIAWSTDQAFFMGQTDPGTFGQPLGVVNGPGALVQTRASSGTITQADLAAMYKQILPGSIGSAVWAFSPTAMEKVSNLTGLGGILYYLPGDDGSAGILYGRPFYVTEKLPDVGTRGDVCFFDPKLYIIGHRNISIDFSDQEPTAFTKYQSVWRMTWRGDGTPMLTSSVTLANQSSTKAAGYVVLSTL